MKTTFCSVRPPCRTRVCALTSVPRGASFLLLLVGCCLPGAATEIAELTLYDAAARSWEDDWLVRRCAVEAGVFRTQRTDEIVLCNGLLRRTFRLKPNGATVGFDNLMTEETILRGVKPEASVTIDGTAHDIGGLKGQPNYAFLLTEWVETLTADPKAFQFTGFEVGKPTERMSWAQVRHHAPGVEWPPKGVSLRLDFRLPERAIAASVHYELYDGVPVLSKWITIQNNTGQPISVDGFKSELLAAVEYSSNPDQSGGTYHPPNLHVETDYAFCGAAAMEAQRFSVRWVADPEYQSQVNYPRQNPCLLEVGPDLGPHVTLGPGEFFQSFHAFELVLDSFDRERNGLTQRRMYRVIAPWVTENPLMMHVRFADREAVERAIDQCAEVGFEMAILTFGSGVDLEDESAENLEKMRQYAVYAQGKGVEMGAYSLLASRHIDDANDVVMPEGQQPTFGHSPCLLSPWGADYFRKLRQFYEKTGFTLLEHDGSYPGDVCATTTHPGHAGLDDSRWKQWRTISEFYRECRARGIYLNVPDYYYLGGSNKSGMGYRETNWSLPRAEQVIHTRQNIYDGTWSISPSMGWMFVPLTEYQGGGAAATIEPLDEHLDHYERMLYSNLAFGVQACYRGPRLYDTERTKTMVQQAVAWFKQYRDILESDIVHGRRADGRDVDWMLHVNPELEEKGLLVVFNPLPEAVERTLEVNLYYTGLGDVAHIAERGDPATEYALARDFTTHLTAHVPANGFTWFVIR